MILKQIVTLRDLLSLRVIGNKLSDEAPTVGLTLDNTCASSLHAILRMRFNVEHLISDDRFLQRT